MVTIGNTEAELELPLGELLADVLPQTAGYSLEIEIYENGRKKRRDASRDSFRPGSSEIRIKFGGAKRTSQLKTSHRLDEDDLGASVAEAPTPVQRGSLGDKRIDIIKSLEMAEHLPGFEFVSLKWFRDSCLPAEPREWSSSSSERDQALRQAIKDGIVLTSKVPNPKDPAYPVTAIRLNRQNPEVVAVLGEPVIAVSGFQPVSIRGETLSDTVLRERR